MIMVVVVMVVVMMIVLVEAEASQDGVAGDKDATPNTPQDGAQQQARAAAKGHQGIVIWAATLMVVVVVMTHFPETS